MQEPNGCNLGGKKEEYILMDIEWKQKQITSYLNTKWLGHSLVYMEQLDSTNVQTKKLAEENALQGTVVVAERQTAGKGRSGRNWISPEGNCYFSMLLRPDIHSEKASMITLVAALAICKAIREVAELDVQIKWPNDIVFAGKKLCGILTESSTAGLHLTYIIVGIGVNVNQKEFAPEIRDMASSLALLNGKDVNQARLLGSIMNWFEVYYERFLETEDMSFLMQEYNMLLINCGKDVRLMECDAIYVAKALGIDSYGGLMVQDVTGQKKTIISGEVSVRGMYGYAE